ncbi:MAG: hypothetical protein AB7F59_05190 [Bdellovibrionales bacterium]
MRTISLILTLSFLNIATTYAGQDGRGGNVVICPGKEVVTLDYYHATLPPSNTVDISRMSRVEVINLFKERLKDAFFLQQFEDALQVIGPSYSWIEDNLKYVDDSNEPYQLPTGCVRKTVAVRQNEETMFKDPAIYRLLSGAQIGILEVHEAFYYVASKVGINTSERIRTLVRALLQTSPDQMAVYKAMSAIGGGTLAIMEKIPGTYVGTLTTRILGEYELRYNEIRGVFTLAPENGIYIDYGTNRKPCTLKGESVICYFKHDDCVVTYNFSPRAGTLLFSRICESLPGSTPHHISMGTLKRYPL